MGQQSLNSCLSYMENNGLGNDELEIQIANNQEIIYNQELTFRTERQALALSLVHAIIERDQRLGDVPAILICPSIEMIRTSHISICPERLLYLRNYYTSDDQNNVSTRLRDLLYSITTQPTNNVFTQPRVYVRNRDPILELQDIAVTFSRLTEYQNRQSNRTIQSYQNGNFQY